MNAPFPIIKSLAIVISLSLAACSSSSSPTAVADPGTPDPAPTALTLSGTAAAGAPIIGTVTVKGALGNTKSALIEANGNYDVDVTGLTAPYRLRAVGTVGGRTYKLHSYAEAATVGATVNITPFTDLIVANAAQQIAESFFDSNVNASIDPADLAAQEDALQAKLKNVLDALGVDSAINLLNSTFSADHSGLDAALDIVRIEVDSGTNIATITNLIDNNTLTDNVTDDADTGTLAVDDAANLQNNATQNQSIAGVFNELTTKFANGLPTAASIENLFTADFLDYDQSLNQFLTEITTDPSMVGIVFGNISIDDLTATTATVTFNISFGNVIDPEPETWFAAKDTDNGWQMRGDQVPADYWFNFHCNDGSGTGNGAGACGVNTMIEDNDFSNNGTNNAAFASATASIIGSDDIVKDVIHLGTPSNANGGSAGNVQIYNAGNGFQGDWKAFGNTIADISSSIFVVGDTVKFDLYTEQLDISNTNAPAIEANATPAFTFSRPILFAPSTTPIYPDATATTIAALPNYALGDDLTISWTKQAGTRNDEVLVQISDSNFNQIQIWTDTYTDTDDSITVAGSQLSTSILDQSDATYELRIRVYAEDVTTGQAHSRDYVATIDGPTAPVTPPPPAATLSCGTESAWNDTLDQPAKFYSYTDFEAVVSDCSSLVKTITDADIIGTWIEAYTDQDGDWTETLVFNANGTVSYTETLGVILQDSVDGNWTVSNDRLTISVGNIFKEVAAILSNGTQKFYSEDTSWSPASDLISDSKADGEIWTGNYTKQ